MQRIFPELKLSRVERHSPQMTFYGPYGTKSVRYDVYSEINSRVFDVEMQMESRKNESRRARYYQCMMGEQELRKGEDYAVLPELKNFLNLINGNAPADDFCREVQEQVREAKKDAETRRYFMEFEYKQMLIAKDAKEEEREKILDSMAAMVKSGRMRAEDVAEVLEVPVETVLAAAAKAEEKAEKDA